MPSKHNLQSSICELLIFLLKPDLEIFRQVFRPIKVLRALLKMLTGLYILLKNVHLWPPYLQNM